MKNKPSSVGRKKPFDFLDICLIGGILVFMGLCFCIGTPATYSNYLLVRSSFNASQLPGKTFQVIVDYNQPLLSMIRAGSYSYIDGDLTLEKFTVLGKGKKEINVTIFGFEPRNDIVLAKMDEQGFRPARIEELLALGEQYPGLQKDCYILALGSICTSNTCFASHSIPYIGWEYGDELARERSLSLICDNGNWSSSEKKLYGICFAAVPKQ